MNEISWRPILTLDQHACHLVNPLVFRIEALLVLLDVVILGHINSSRADLNRIFNASIAGHSGLFSFLLAMELIPQ